MDNQDDSWNAVVSPTIEVKADEIEKIRIHPVKIELTAEDIIKRNKIKKYVIFGGIPVLLLIFILIIVFRPKDPKPIYEKYEEFGACISNTEKCFQDVMIYSTGKVIYSGKIKKETQITSQKTRNIKNIIMNSNLMDSNCKEAQILMEYKVTHKFFIGGTLKEIQSPGCESELESLDISIENILK